MKILLLGKSGQVGWELQRSLAPLGALIALDRHSSEYCGDLSNLDGIATTIRNIKPDVIVNAAAYTAVDKAESEPELAKTINASAVSVMASEASTLGALLVHYSTDYVFDGSGNKPWQEADKTAPLSTYGKTKREGEEAILATCPKHLIFRTSWVYAARGKNFAKTMIRLAQEKDKLTVINDQFGAPTGAELLADVTAHAIRAVANDSKKSGLYHLAARGETNWHSYACFVIDKARQMGVDIKVLQDMILAVPSSAFPTLAKRPNNSRLDVNTIENAFHLTLPPWQNGVERMLNEVYGTQA